MSFSVILRRDAMQLLNRAILDVLPVMRVSDDIYFESFSIKHARKLILSLSVYCKVYDVKLTDQQEAQDIFEEVVAHTWKDRMKFLKHGIDVKFVWGAIAVDDLYDSCFDIFVPIGVKR